MDHLPNKRRQWSSLILSVAARVWQTVAFGRHAGMRLVRLSTILSVMTPKTLDSHCNRAVPPRTLADLCAPVEQAP